MRLLVPNARNAQPYAVVQSLLAAEGMSVVAPPLDVVLRVNDKFRCMERLADSGLPIPRTRLLESGGLGRAPEGLTFPLVVKPRFASASRGVHMVPDRAALEATAAAVTRRFRTPIVQE